MRLSELKELIGTENPIVKKLQKEVKKSESRLSEIRDRIGYNLDKNAAIKSSIYPQKFIDSFLEHIEDENVQFFIKIMHECMNEDDGLRGYQENLIPSRFKIFFDAETYLMEYIGLKIA